MKDKMENKKIRNSSIEFLRIIAMLLIISQHYVFHGGYDPEIFNNVSANIIYLKMIKMFGYSSCTIFALITGYFMIDANTKHKYYRRAFHLIMVSVFYSLLSMAILLIGKFKTFTFREIKDMLFSFLYGNWYVVFYIVLLFFIPFINKMLKSLDQKEYKKLIWTMFILFIIVQNIFGDVYQLGNLDFMIMGYIFGAYYKLYKESINFNPDKVLLLGIGCFVLVLISVPVMDYVGVLLNNPKFIRYDYTFMGWNNIFSFIFSVSVFIYAVNKSFYSSIINTLASTIIGVYMLHDGPLKYLIWEVISPNVQYVSSPYLHSVIKIVLVFLGCALIDLIRKNTIDRIFSKWLFDMCDRSSIEEL